MTTCSAGPSFTLLDFQLCGKLGVLIPADAFGSPASFMPCYSFGAKKTATVAARRALSTCLRRHVSGAAQSKG
jgi:hypothetical protein